MHTVWNWNWTFFHILIGCFPVYSMLCVICDTPAFVIVGADIMRLSTRSATQSKSVTEFSFLTNWLLVSSFHCLSQLGSWVLSKTGPGLSQSQEEYFPKMIIQWPCQAQQPNLCQILFICILTLWKATASALNSPLFQPNAQSAPYSLVGSVWAMGCRSAGPPKVIWWRGAALGPLAAPAL